MVEPTPVIKAMTLPTMVKSLPIKHLLLLAMGSVLPFIMFNSMWFLFIFPIFWPLFFFAAEKDPYMIEVFLDHTTKFPRTILRNFNGGDLYVN